MRTISTAWCGVLLGLAIAGCEPAPCAARDAAACGAADTARDALADDASGGSSDATIDAVADTPDALVADLVTGDAPADAPDVRASCGVAPSGGCVPSAPSVRCCPWRAWRVDEAAHCLRPVQLLQQLLGRLALGDRLEQRPRELIGHVLVTRGYNLARRRDFALASGANQNAAVCRILDSREAVVSEHNIVVIPAEPGVVPSTDALERATALLRRLVPSASVVEAELHDALVLVDCGGNFEAIACRACGAPVEIETWHAWMDADWDDARRGFVLRERAMPCCGAPTTLHALRYEWPMGFARCAIAARRHTRRTLASHEVAALEACLGCAVRVIYQHY